MNTVKDYATLQTIYEIPVSSLELLANMTIFDTYISFKISTSLECVFRKIKWLQVFVQ